MLCAVIVLMVSSRETTVIMYFIHGYFRRRLHNAANPQQAMPSPRLGGSLFCVPARESVFPEGGSMKSEQNVHQLQEQMTRTAIDGFNEAFNRHDADGLAAFLTEDTVFEDTSPAPDGRRIEGKAAVVEFWRGWFVHNQDARFETEEVIVSESRATVLWVYRKTRNAQQWHLRGVDVFTVRDGKVAAKLAYVKG